jgi:hypothetical protein
VVADSKKVSEKCIFFGADVKNVTKSIQSEALSQKWLHFLMCRKRCHKKCDKLSLSSKIDTLNLGVVICMVFPNIPVSE